MTIILTKVITMVTELLVPEKVNVMWSSQRFKGQCQLKEKWFGTSYSCEGTCILYIVIVHCDVTACDVTTCDVTACVVTACVVTACDVTACIGAHYYADSGPCIYNKILCNVHCISMEKKHLLFHYLDIPDKWKDEWQSEYNYALKLCTCVDHFQFHYITYIVQCVVH